MVSSTNADVVAVTVNEFCSALRIGRTRFYKDVKDGNIKIVKIGSKTVIPIAERNAYLRRMAREPF